MTFNYKNTKDYLIQNLAHKNHNPILKTTNNLQTNYTDNQFTNASITLFGFEKQDSAILYNLSFKELNSYSNKKDFGKLIHIPEQGNLHRLLLNILPARTQRKLQPYKDLLTGKYLVSGVVLSGYEHVEAHNKLTYGYSLIQYLKSQVAGNQNEILKITIRDHDFYYIPNINEFLELDEIDEIA